MSRSKSESLLGLTESFFHNYLQHTRGASGHTVRAYRDALKLFYLFLADKKRKPVADLGLDDIQSDAVLAFLDHVESRRWRYAPVIFSWKDHGKCVCWAKAERNESVPFGPKPHQPYIGSFA
jgi:hypothetical protein